MTTRNRGAALRGAALFVLLITASDLQAQDSFMVMSVKGKVESSKGNSGKWKKVNVGQILGAKDVVKTSFASYAKLMMNQQRLVSIDENTAKPLSEFVAENSGKSQSATGKILQYATQQMERAKKSRTQSVFGAVRGQYDVFSAVFPKYQVMTTHPAFEWVDTDTSNQYEFMLLDSDFNMLDRVQTPHRSFTYDSLRNKIENGRTYHWRVTRGADGLESDVQTFQVLAKDTIENVQWELENLDHELSTMNADEVTKHLIRAIYFEKRSLFADAFREYKATIALAPDVSEYQDLMDNLLMNLRLYNEKEYLLRK